MNSVKQIAQDVIEHIEEDLVKKILRTPHNRLFIFHHSLGRKIRNEYNLWSNTKLLKKIGCNHPDDASSLIIEEVYSILNQNTTNEEVLSDKELFDEWRKERGIK